MELQNDFTEMVQNLDQKEEKKLDKLMIELQKLYSLQIDKVVQPERMTFEKGLLYYQDPKDGEMVIAPDRNMFTQMGRSFKLTNTALDYLQSADPSILDDMFTKLFKWEGSRGKNGRTWFARTYKKGLDDKGGIESPWKGRAFLARRYKIIDHMPIFQATVENVQRIAIQRNLNIRPITQNLSDNNLFMRFICPDLETKSWALKNYKSPDGNPGGSICTGFIITNSEVGRGRFGIAPRMFQNACLNGHIFASEGLFKNHVGDMLPEGFNYSERTLEKEMDAIVSMIGDAVERYLSEDFLGKRVEEIEFAASQKLRYPGEAIKNICKDLNFTAEQTANSVNWLMNQGGEKGNNFAITQALTYEAKNLSGEDRWRVESWSTQNMKNLSKYDIKFDDPETSEKVAELLN